jgi:secondary thiamine-phosphate synthase enzyme
MLFFRTEFEQISRGRGTYDLTERAQAAVAVSGVRVGVCTAFVHHTSASIIICENADPDVRSDLDRFFARLVPDGDSLFEHTAEGPDDMPSHVRSVLTQTSLTVPISRGRLDLGTWQGLYLYEHRRAAHTRRISLSIVGDK